MIIGGVMLLVDNYIGLSNIHGKGLFANEDIAAGSIIWQFHKSTCQSYFKKLFLNYCNQLDRERLLEVISHSYLRNGVVYRPTDHTKFINHSFEPNTAFLDDKTLVAIRDIQKGEEVLENYLSSFDPNDFYYLKVDQEPSRDLILYQIKEHLLNFEINSNPIKLSS